MKKIQNKLKTPTTSMDTLTRIDSEKNREPEPKSPEVQEVPIRNYQNTGPPSVNMGTWSDRPKVSVSVKEDEDYKLGQGTNKRYPKISVQNIANSSNVMLKQFTNSNMQKVTITCNGSSEPNKDYNGLMKKDQIRGFPESDADSHKSFYDVSKSSPRPHSVAFPSDFDISRVPVVRSVELKKSFRDIRKNTSVIQLNQSDGYYAQDISEKSREFNQETVSNGKDSAKPIMRAKSFLQPSPVVRGFRTLENNVNSKNINGSNQPYNRFSWQPNTSMTLPSTPKKENFATNQNVPFSRLNLRRTESKTTSDSWVSLDRNKTLPEPFHREPTENTILPNPVIPSPPQMPKSVQKKITHRQFVPDLDPRDELLKSIRNFGGQKGLRSRKA